jgi:hypothetical protein
MQAGSSRNIFLGAARRAFGRFRVYGLGITQAPHNYMCRAYIEAKSVLEKVSTSYFKSERKIKRFLFVPYVLVVM